MVTGPWDWWIGTCRGLMGEHWPLPPDAVGRSRSLASELEVELLRLENAKLKAAYARVKHLYWEACLEAERD